MKAAESALCDAYIKRTQELRIASGRTQQEMAVALGISVERYKKYETRTPLPIYLVPRFANIINRDVAHVVAGTASRRGPRKRIRPTKQP